LNEETAAWKVPLKIPLTRGSCEEIQCVVGNGRRTVPCRDYEAIANESVVRSEERCGERSLQQSDDFIACGAAQPG
jgi:hypothetical protein